MNQSASIPFRDAGRRKSHASDMQRWGGLVGGSLLAIYGLTRRSAVGVAMAAGGGALAYFAANVNQRQKVNARTQVLLNTSPADAYRIWHNFEQLPLFMHHIESVSAIGDRRYRWIALGPLGMRVTWDAEITQDREPHVIAWRSLPGSEIAVDGEVRFEPATADRGTIITSDIRYTAPAGKAGHVVAKIFGKNPHFLMEQDLRRFKALVEAGEIPTVEGQTHGPRSALAGAARMLDPDRSVRQSSAVNEVFAAKRRVS